MTTLKRMIRTANASYKSSARATERRAKEMAKQYQQKLKQQIAANDDAAIHTYNEYIDVLLAVHEGCSEPLDWDSFTSDQEPKEPEFWPLWENEADFNLLKYEPSFFDIVTGQNRRKVRDLRKKLVEARAEDLEIHKFNQRNYLRNKEDWDLVQSLKNGIKKGDPAIYKMAMDFFDPYAKITHLGSSLNCDTYSEYLSFNVYIDGTAIIPDYIFAQPATGGLSSKKLSPERFNKIYLDYICRCALYIARETFALLPVQYIHVNVMPTPLSTLNGGLGNQAILSAKFNPDVLKKQSNSILEGLMVSINATEGIPSSIISDFPTTAQ